MVDRYRERVRIDGGGSHDATGELFYGVDMESRSPVLIKVFHLKNAVDLSEFVVSAPLDGVDSPLWWETGEGNIVRSVIRFSRGTRADEIVHGVTHSTDEILDIVIRAGVFIRRLHRRGYLLGEFSPKNIIVGAEGVTIRDFGLGSILSHKNGNLILDEHDQESPFLAPETLHDGVVVESSDTYSLGVVLFVLLGGDIHEVVPGMPIVRFPENFDYKLKILVERMTAPDCSVRPSTEAAVRRLKLYRRGRGRNIAGTILPLLVIVFVLVVSIHVKRERILDKKTLGDKPILEKLVEGIGKEVALPGNEFYGDNNLSRPVKVSVRVHGGVLTLLESFSVDGKVYERGYFDPVFDESWIKTYTFHSMGKVYSVRGVMKSGGSELTLYYLSFQ